MRIALIALGIIALIALVVGLWFVFAPKEEPIGYVQFPQAEDRVITTEGDDIFYPDRGYGYREIDIQPQPRSTARTQEEEVEEPSRGFVQSLSSFIAGLIGRYRPGSDAGEAPGSAVPEDAGGIGVSGSGSIPFVSRGDGGVYSGPSPYYQYPNTNTGDDDANDTNGDLRDDVSFDPQTGDLYVGNIHFNFTGMQTVANNTTSDVVGDPDNMTLGTTIGSFIGALIGDPAMGLVIGTAIGSNLIDGFTLEDLGIGLDNGIPTFGGVNPLEEGSPFGEGSGESEDQGGSGENSYFSGYAFSMVCTCSAGNYIVYNFSEEYGGTYLISPDSEAYEEYGNVGFFAIIGSYDQGTGSGECEMYVGESCEEFEIDKGKINALPGYGTSGEGD